MMRSCIVLAGAFFPLLSFACDSTDRHKCEEQFIALVSYRTEAIQAAFGNLFGTLPAELQVKFVRTKDPDYARFGGHEAYDQEHRKLIFPRYVLGAKTPNPLRWAGYYWPFYQEERYRIEFPIIEAVDNVLWSAFLQEAAKARGLSWPHKDCASVDVTRRLPCEMLVKGIAEHVKELRSPIFNSNRLDRIWPEDFSGFRKRVWRKDNQEYMDVQRYGGILLIRPLINEFGVPRALMYVAQTPFRVEENNMRTSALRYQEQAREALTMMRVTGQPVVLGEQYVGSPSPPPPRTAVADVSADSARSQ